MINKKDEFKGIIGKTIKSVIFVEDNPTSPYNQAFLVFDDDTFFEICGQYFQGTGVKLGNEEETLNYAKLFSGKISIMKKTRN